MKNEGRTKWIEAKMKLGQVAPAPRNEKEVEAGLSILVKESKLEPTERADSAQVQEPCKTLRRSPPPSAVPVLPAMVIPGTRTRL